MNALLHHCRGNLSGIGGVARPGIVHRLDRDTSGCLVVAKNDVTHRELRWDHPRRAGSKSFYQCIVCGELQPPSGEILGRIARHTVDRKDDGHRGRRTGLPDHVSAPRAPAVRIFVEARIHTGRTHQVRVHFQHLGFLVGDHTYGHRANARLTAETGFQASRQLLHAGSWRLSTLHAPMVRFQRPAPRGFQGGPGGTSIKPVIDSSTRFRPNPGRTDELGLPFTGDPLIGSDA